MHLPRWRRGQIFSLLNNTIFVGVILLVVYSLGRMNLRAQSHDEWKLKTEILTSSCGQLRKLGPNHQYLARPSHSFHVTENKYDAWRSHDLVTKKSPTSLDGINLLFWIFFSSVRMEYSRFVEWMANRSNRYTYVQRGLEIEWGPDDTGWWFWNCFDSFLNCFTTRVSGHMEATSLRVFSWKARLTGTVDFGAFLMTSARKLSFKFKTLSSAMKLHKMK